MRVVNGFELPRVLTPPQAERLGLTRGRVRTELRRGNWQRLASGIVLTRPEDPTRGDWADVGVALAGRGAAVTGWDAVRVRGLGDRRPPHHDVVVVCPNGANRIVGGVRLSRTSRAFTRTTVSALSEVLPLLPVVPAARAVVDTALRDCAPGRVRALVTSSVQRRACRVEDLMAELGRAPRCGSRWLRLAMADAVDGARSAAEARALGRLRSSPVVPAFEMNVPVVLAGQALYCVDFLWRALRAVLEIDSREYHFKEADWRDTMTRHNALIAAGFAVTHYPPSLVGRPGWADEVAEWLRARARELGLPYPRARGVIRPPIGASPPPVVISG